MQICAEPRGAESRDNRTGVPLGNICCQRSRLLLNRSVIRHFRQIHITRLVNATAPSLADGRLLRGIHHILNFHKRELYFISIIQSAVVACLCSSQCNHRIHIPLPRLCTQSNHPIRHNPLLKTTDSANFSNYSRGISFYLIFAFQNRIASFTHPSATVPVPIPNPCPRPS